MAGRPTGNEIRVVFAYFREFGGNRRQTVDRVSDLFAHRINIDASSIDPYIVAAVETGVRDGLLAIGYTREALRKDLRDDLAEELVGVLPEDVITSLFDPGLEPDVRDLIEALPAEYVDVILPGVPGVPVTIQRVPIEVANRETRVWTLDDIWRNQPETFDRLFPSLRQMVRGYVGQSVGRGFSDAISKLIVRSIDPRNPMFTDEVAAQIMRDFPQLAAYRAKMIARTEMQRAYQQAQYATFEENGVTSRRWVTAQNSIFARRSPVCRRCLENAAQGWVPMTEPFRSGHMAPPVHPNCRCDVIPNVFAEFDSEPWPLRVFFRSAAGVGRLRIRSRGSDAAKNFVRARYRPRSR